MKKFRPLTILLITLGVTASPSVFSQAHCNLLQAGNGAAATHSAATSYWFGVMELPFLFIAVFFAFMTAHALRGGKFGQQGRLVQ